MTGSEFLVGAAAEGIAALITDMTKAKSGSAIAGVISGLKDKSKQAIFNASRKYIETYQKRHCQIRVLGMREPVALASVYTGVKLLDSRDILQFDPDALEESFKKARFGGYGSRGREEEKQSGLTIANEKQYLMVLGGPGAGKSTFLRKVGLESLRTFYYEGATYQPRVIPVLLELKRFHKDDVDIAKFIAAEFETCGFPEPEAFMQNALEQGNLLVMLDGLDEVPSANLNNVLDTIRDFVDRYDSNRFITSCRIAASGYRGSAFQRFSNVTMADFDDEQIEQFIDNWFSSETDKERKTAQKCWEVLQKEENKASKELAHTPLLLTYLCLVYRSSQKLPRNRSILYRKALRILLEEWAADKGIWSNEVYDGLSTELEEILLSEIAYKGMKEELIFFDKRTLSRQIRKFIESNLNVDKGLNSEKVLNTIEAQQGILVERMEEKYSFSHLTLQEYLTAQYLVDNNEWPELVRQHVTDNHYREIFLLLPGLMSSRDGADRLLLTMKQQMDECINTPRLRALLTWAENVVDTNQERPKLLADRSAAIFLVRALDLGHSLGLAYVLDLNLVLDRDLAHVLNLILALDIDLACALARFLDIDLAINRTRSLDLDRSLDLAIDFRRTDVFCTVDFDELLRSLEELKSKQTGRSASRQEKQTFVDSVYTLWFSSLGIDSDVVALTSEETQSLINYLLHMRTHDSL